MANDVDYPTETLTATWDSGPSHGSLTFNADGSFSYTPNAGFVGEDDFTYSVSDGLATSGSVGVTIDVWNTVPGAASDHYRLHHGETLSGETVMANDWDDDGDSLTASLSYGGGVSNGTLTFNADGTFEYTPNPGFVGTDGFTYEISDGVTTSSASVRLIVQNKVPVAVGDSFRVHHDGSLPAGQSVIANDYDGDQDSLTAILVSDVSHGTLSFNSAGTFSYTPNAGYVGGDSFTYKLNDGADDSETATVSIDVWNNIPWAHGNYFETQHGVAVSGDVLWDDTDWDGDTVEAELVDDIGGYGYGSYGSLAFNSDGTFTYTPDSSYSGSVSFTYRVMRRRRV